MLAGFALSAAICWFMIRNLHPVLRKERMQEDATSRQSTHRGSTLRFGGAAVIAAFALVFSLTVDRIENDKGQE